jgi:hypothetical protein
MGDEHDNFCEPANPNVIHASQEAVGAQTLPAETPLRYDAGRIGPRSRLGVRYALDQHDFLDDPQKVYCERHARGTAGDGCYGFLMTRTIRSTGNKNSGNKSPHRPISYSRAKSCSGRRL